MKKQFLLFSTLALASSLSFAQGVAVTNTFTSGQPAVAAEVNQNFQDVVTGVNNNGTAIITNENNITANTGNITTNTNSITNNAVNISTNSANVSTLTSRVTALESAIDPISTTLPVDCSSQTISSVIASAPAYGQLTLDITGACTETLVITRDNISLVGTGAGASIAYDSEITNNEYRSSITNTVTLIGANNIIIDNMTLRDATTNGFSAGLRLLNNASVLLKNSTIENTVIGIWASHSSTVQMSGNTIQNNSSYSALITDAAVAEIRENNTLTGDNGVAGVGIYRNGTVRVQEGTNTITNTSLTANAVEAFHGSQFRSERGTLTVNGGISAGTFSQVELRDTVVTGNVLAFNQGTIRLRSTTGPVTINGDLTINALGTLLTSGASSINGDVNCPGNALSYYQANPTVSGTIDANCTTF